MDRLLAAAELKVRERWAQHKNKSTKAFSDYLKKQTKRCGLIRTLIYDKQSAKLEDLYVSQSLRVGKLGDWRTTRNISSDEFSEFIAEARDPEKYRPAFCGVVSGPAGAGKSFLMRFLFLALVRRNIDQVPIFIEARDLNDRKKHRPRRCDISGVCFSRGRIHAGAGGGRPSERPIYYSARWV